MSTWWNRNAHIRTFAIPLVVGKASTIEIQDAVVERFGAESRPTDRQVSQLRHHVAGKARTAVQYANRERKEKGKKKQYTKPDGPGLDDAGIGIGCGVSVRYSAHRDIHLDNVVGGSLGDFSFRRRPFGNHASSQEDIARLRPVSERVRRLLTTEPIDGCRLPGAIRISGYACILRQLRAFERYTKLYACGMSLNPEYRLCADCPNWLPDRDYKAAQQTIRRNPVPGR